MKHLITVCASQKPLHPKHRAFLWILGRIHLQPSFPLLSLISILSNR